MSFTGLRFIAMIVTGFTMPCPDVRLIRVKQNLTRSVFMVSIRRLLVVAILSTISLQSAFAQKLVEPDKVAPEYREAAEKRRVEQIKLMECSRKADTTKVLRRDRAEFIQNCLDAQ
jgi:hypothetical protein